MDYKIIFRQLEKDEIGYEDTLSFIQHPNIFIRSAALLSIGRQLRRDGCRDDGIINVLVEMAINKENLHAYTLGIISVAYLAVACLFECGTAKALDKATTIIEAMAERDRQELFLVLKGFDSAKPHIEKFL